MRYIFLFCLLPILSFAQRNRQEKIIIIKNYDTTILESDVQPMDSLIEWNVKSIYRTDKEFNRFPTGFRLDVIIDSIFGDLDETNRAYKEENRQRTNPQEGKRVIIIEKEIHGYPEHQKHIIEEDIITEQRLKNLLQKEKRTFDIRGERDFFSDENAHWAGFSIGINGFLNPQGGVATEPDLAFLELDYAKSQSVQLNFWEKRFPLIDAFLGITTGLGFQWNRYELQKNVDLFSNADSLYALANAINHYRTNVLNATFLQFPLLLDFNAKAEQEKHLLFSLGIIGGLRLGSNWKTKWESDGHWNKTKTINDFNLNALSANAYAQIGYGKVGVFLQYGLNDVFRQGKGPELRPVSAGIKIHF